jgi:hypothetical protein
MRTGNQATIGTRPPPRRFDKLARRPSAVRIPAPAWACHLRKPGEVAGA